MRAISIRDPHATAIVFGTKRLVTCTWLPPAKLIEVVREVGRNVLEVRKRLST